MLKINYPEISPHLSSAKSPQQMFGAVAKTYAAEILGVNPANMVSVSVMPCTAKKYECDRPEMVASGFQDVDYVITTRELAPSLVHRWTGVVFTVGPALYILLNFERFARFMDTIVLSVVSCSY